MTTQIVQKIKQDTHERLEELKQRSVEQARENFTRLPGYLIEQVFGIKNFTPFDEDARKKMGESFDQQDVSKLDETRSELRALKTQMDLVRNDEAAAKEYFRKKEEERENEQKEDDERKRIEKEQKAQAQANVTGPSTHAPRGMRARKMPTQTVENKASFGKQ